VVCCGSTKFADFFWLEAILIIFVLQVLSGIALVSFKLAKAPRDKEHPYGHLICIYTLLHLSLIICIKLLFYCVIWMLIFNMGVRLGL
jgi:hypothetical protein